MKLFIHLFFFYHIYPCITRTNIMCTLLIYNVHLLFLIGKTKKKISLESYVLHRILMLENPVIWKKFSKILINEKKNPVKVTEMSNGVQVIEDGVTYEGMDSASGRAISSTVLIVTMTDVLMTTLITCELQVVF